MQGVLRFVFCQHFAELGLNNSDCPAVIYEANLAWSTRNHCLKGRVPLTTVIPVVPAD